MSAPQHSQGTRDWCCGTPAVHPFWGERKGEGKVSFDLAKNLGGASNTLREVLYFVLAFVNYQKLVKQNSWLMMLSTLVAGGGVTNTICLPLNDPCPGEHATTTD